MPRSDCRATDEQDPAPAALRVPDLAFLSPADDSEFVGRLEKARGTGRRSAGSEPFVTVSCTLHRRPSRRTVRNDST